MWKVILTTDEFNELNNKDEIIDLELENKKLRESYSYSYKMGSYNYHSKWYTGIELKKSQEETLNLRNRLIVIEEKNKLLRQSIYLYFILLLITAIISIIMTNI